MTTMHEHAAPEAWAARIRAVGLRVTPRRIALLEALVEHPHSTVDEVHARASTAVPHLTKQAVYVSLGDFQHHGLVRRIDPPNSPARYETRTDDNHHHLVCDNCGTIVDVDCSVGAAPCLHPADEAGFEVHLAEVTYRGLCADCLAERNAARQPTQTTPSTPTEEQE